jgi:uncharacterized membrane protein YkoI
MKINRFVALAAIALLVVGGMGVISYRAFAQHSAAPAVQTQDCPQDQNVEDQTQGPDTDAVEQQCGDQNEANDVENNSDGESNQSGEAKDAATNESDEAAALQSQAKISAEQAQQVALDANPGATAVKTELDNENGQVVYSVELSTGVEVKVDAVSGAILTSDTSQGN